MNSLFRQEIYKDKWLVIICIPLITFLIQHVGLSWAEIKEYTKENYYWNNLIFNATMVILSLTINRFIINHLDQHHSFRPNFRKRIILQIGISLITILSITEFLAYLYVKVWAKADYWEARFSTDFPLSIILIILLNLIYIGFFLNHESKIKSSNSFVPQQKMPTNQQKVLEVQLGNKTFLLAQEKIALEFCQNFLDEKYADC